MLKGRGGVGLFVLVVLAAGVWCAGWAHGQEAPEGLASKYPGDRGIENDEDVIFVENFEAGSVDAVKSHWESVKAAEIMSLSADVPTGSAGSKSLLLSHVGGKGTGGHLYRGLMPGYDQLYARFYVKFAPDCAPVHHFGTNMGGNNPPTRWPMVSAGNRPAGDKSFWSGVEPGGWVWDYYTYWVEMRGSPPAGKTWGNSFIRDPNLKVERGEWTCVELMMKVNDVGDTDGEMALWIDGKQVSHLGKGFPEGLWVYDKFTPGKGGQGVRWNDRKGGPENFRVPAGGQSFEGFRWRTVEELKVNYVWIYLYITKAPQGHVNRVWFDDVVVAKKYIGPISPAE